MKKKTQGFSRKVAAAVLGAAGTQLVAFVVNLIASGAFDRTEAAQLAGVALTAIFGTALGFLQEPDTVVIDQGR